jgi:RNA polymerase sigma-70 factor (ECF subfamily)
MKNIFINSYRRNGNYREVIRKACNSGEYYYWSNDIVEDTDSSLYISELWNIVEKLEEKFRFPFICFLNGYKYKEIAELMSLPIGTIKSRIFYARKFLSEELVEF